MKQSFAYSILAIQSQRGAQELAEDSRDFLKHPDHNGVRQACAREQTMAAQLYALARGRMEEAHGWEAIEP